MTIAGSVYVASLFFFVLALRYPHLNLEGLATRFNPYLTYVAVGLVALSYVFGFVAHRVIQVAIDGRKIVKLWWQDLQLFPLNQQLPDEKKIVREELRETLMEEMNIWALCSDRVHREMDFQFPQLALFRSLTVSSLLLAASIAYWCHPTYLLADMSYFAVFYVLLILVFLRQSSQYKMIREDALFVARTHPDYWTPILSPNCGKEKSKVTIRGINFGDTKETCVVKFDNATADFDTWGPTQIIVLVPQCLLNGSDIQKSVAITVAVDLPDPRTPHSDKYQLQLTCPPFTVIK